MATTKALELGQFGTDLTVDDSTGAVTIANDVTVNAATSTGIDDNADQTVITIANDETVTIAGNLEVSEIGNNSTGLITIDVDATAHAMLRFQEAGSDLWRIVKEPTNELVIDQGSGDIDFTFSTTGNFTVHDGDVIIETGGIKGPSVLYIDPATYDTDSDAGSAAGTVRIRGDLIVDGDTTTINSTTLTVDDLNIVLASGAADSATADGAGITIDGADATLTYVDSGDKFSFNKSIDTDGLNVDGHTTLNTASTLIANLNYNNSNRGRIATNGIDLYLEATANMALKVNSLTSAYLHGTGDIDFYENNGGSPKVGMHWDYNAGRLGIDTDSPSVKLHIQEGTGSLVEAFRISDSSYTNISMYSGGADGEIKIGAAGQLRGSYKAQYAGTGGSFNFNIGTNATNAITIDTSQNVEIATGDLTPGTATQDLGTSADPWQNIYTQDLNLSNEKRDEGNSVDGTKGNWTIQEGDEHLYIINNKSGKKYRFALEEIE